MRELFAFIRAAAELQAHKIKARIDGLFTDVADPFDVADDLIEIENLVQLIDDAERLGCPADRVTEYIGQALDLDLLPWQVEIIEIYCGEQVTPMSAPDPAVVDPTEVTGQQVEEFLNRVAAVTSTITVHPSMVHAYLVGVLGIELQQWQLDLLRAYYGQQRPPIVGTR